MDEHEKKAHFEAMVLPHLHAAYNLARWLTRNEHDAQDVVQESFLRAYKFFESFRGSNGRAWLLSIVRNACYSWLQQNRKPDLNTSFDGELDEIEGEGASPDALLLREDDINRVQQALEQLPTELREAMVLREMEELSYKEIAAVTQAPIGTVMSRLSRARKQLERSLAAGMVHGGVL